MSSGFLWTLWLSSQNITTLFSKSLLIFPNCGETNTPLNTYLLHNNGNNQQTHYNCDVRVHNKHKVTWKRWCTIYTLLSRDFTHRASRAEYESSRHQKQNLKTAKYKQWTAREKLEVNNNNDKQALDWCAGSVTKETRQEGRKKNTGRFGKRSEGIFPRLPVHDPQGLRGGWRWGGGGGWRFVLVRASRAAHSQRTTSSLPGLLTSQTQHGGGGGTPQSWKTKQNK